MYEIHQPTDPNYSPWDLLPAPEPASESPPFGYFYDKVAKHLIKDTVRIMMNGLPIDLEKVRELESVLDETLAKVEQELSGNQIVASYQSERYAKLKSEYEAERLSMCRSPEYYLKPFDSKKPEHRSYFMHLFATEHNLSQPSELLPTGVPKWSAKDVKLFASSRPILQRLLKHELNESNSPTAASAALLLAQHKSDMHNSKYVEQARTYSGLEFPPFNPASPDQKHAVFTDMLGFESDKLTDGYKEYEKKLRTSKRYGTPPPEPPKNKYSWDRDNIELVMKTTDDPITQQLCQTLIDHSFGAIVKNNFITASANIEELDPEAEGLPVVRERMDGVDLQRVMSNSFGFGGTNSTLVFQKYAG